MKTLDDYTAMRRKAQAYAELYEERAGIKEFDGLMDRQQAEKEAFTEVLQLFKQEVQGASEFVLKQCIGRKYE